MDPIGSRRPRGMASETLWSHTRVAPVGVAIGPPMPMIRHRFGGILRAARAGILRRRPSLHRRSTRSPSIPSHLDRGSPTPGSGPRATDERAGTGADGTADAPTEIGRASPPIGDEEDSG